jgi:hypothetical protein
VPHESQLAAETAAKEKKAKEELEKEKERVIKEYQEKQKQREERKKKRKEKSKEEDKDKTKDKDEKKEQEEEDAEKEKKVKELEQKAEKDDEDIGPQVFALNRLTFEQRRGNIITKERARQMEELAKKTQKYIRTPGAFPSVPSGEPSKSKPPGSGPGS